MLLNRHTNGTESLNPRFFLPKKAKFVSNKPMFTKMGPFGLMAKISISMGLCSFAETGSALRQRGLAGPVASVRTWRCARSMVVVIAGNRLRYWSRRQHVSAQHDGPRGLSPVVLPIADALEQLIPSSAAK